MPEPIVIVTLRSARTGRVFYVDSCGELERAQSLGRRLHEAHAPPGEPTIASVVAWGWSYAGRHYKPITTGRCAFEFN